MMESTLTTHPLVARLIEAYRFPALSAETFEEWIATPGDAVVFFTEDPQRYRETLDVAVILPELLRAMSGRARAAVLMPEDARVLAARWGVRRWPALVFLRAGEYVGAIEGLRDWAGFVQEAEALLVAPTRRPPGIGVAVTSPGAGESSCH